MKNITSITAIMFSAAMAFAMPATAQQQGSEATQTRPMQSAPMMKGQMKGGMMSRGMMECPMMNQMQGQPRTEGRLAFLKAELNIQSNQEGAWSNYAEAVHRSHQSMTDHRATMRQKMMNQDNSAQSAYRTPAPMALKNRIEMMEGMLANLKLVETATSALYEKLDQSQKLTADDLLGASCGMML